MNMFIVEESDRINQTLSWYESDSIECYQSENNYSPTEIEYRFNSHGFRCDEFPDEQSTERAPILFMGGSTTEGVGLPLHHCWPHFILEKMKAMPKYAGKHIPFYSLAMSGTGVDAASRLLAAYADRIKPKVVCFLLPSIYTRDYKYEGPRYSKWNIGQEAQYPFSSLFSNLEYATTYTYRSLRYMNLLARVYDFEVILSISEHDQIPYFGQKLSNITVIPTLHHYDLLASTSCGPDVDSAPYYARNKIEQGAKWHYFFAAQAYNAISLLGLM